MTVDTLKYLLFNSLHALLIITQVSTNADIKNGELMIKSVIGFKRAGWESACGEVAFAWRRACLVVRVRDANG